jgi:hypothetical protein
MHDKSGGTKETSRTSARDEMDWGAVLLRMRLHLLVPYAIDLHLNQLIELVLT